MIHQRVAVTEQDVGHTLLFGDLPHSFLVVEVGGILGQPQDLNVLADIGMSQEGGGPLRRVNRSVVQREDDALTSSSRAKQQSTDEEKKLGAVLASFDDARDERAVLTRGVVDGPEGGDLAVLAGRRDLHLLSSPHPGLRQVRMKMEVGFVLEPEFVSSPWSKSPFFRA
jgi:hypothetical protein